MSRLQKQVSTGLFNMKDIAFHVPPLFPPFFVTLFLLPFHLFPLFYPFIHFLLLILSLIHFFFPSLLDHQVLPSITRSDKSVRRLVYRWVDGWVSKCWGGGYKISPYILVPQPTGKLIDGLSHQVTGITTTSSTFLYSHTLRKDLLEEAEADKEWFSLRDKSSNRKWRWGAWILRMVVSWKKKVNRYF